MTHPHRKTLKRVNHPGHLRYLTFSCYHQLPLLSNDRIKDAFADRLAFVQEQMDFRLIAWVVMPEHVHLLMLPGATTVTEFSRRLKARFAKQVLDRWRALDAAILSQLRDKRGRCRFWQAGGGYDRNIIHEDSACEKIDYIHANPIRRGLAKSAIDWKWSSAGWYAGDRDGKPKVDFWQSVQ